MRVFILQFVISNIFTLLNASTKSSSPPVSCSKTLACKEWISVTYGDLAVDDDLFGEADFNGISL